VVDWISKVSLKDLVKLKTKKYRDCESKYIISGERAIQGALPGLKNVVESFLVEEGMIEKSQELQEVYPLLRSAKCLKLTTKEFKSITDEKNPQGLAIVVRKPKPIDLQIPGDRRSVIYLDRINDPGNLGTIIRTAAWFGISTILLSPESADPFQGKSVRASAGMITQMHIFENIDLERLVSIRNRWKYKLVSSVPDKGISLCKLKKNSEMIVLFGSEADGLKRELLNLSDMEIQIPRIAYGESLNLAIAVGCFLYQLTIPGKGV
jgi:TrmH family RNA methyltransferase